MQQKKWLRYLLSFLLLCVFSKSNGQTIFEKSERINIKNSQWIAGILAFKNDTISAIIGEGSNLANSTNYSIQHFSKTNLAKIHEQEISIPKRKNQISTLVSVASLGSKMLGFCTILDRSLGKNSLVAFNIENEAEEAELAAIEIFSDSRPGSFLIKENTKSKQILIISEKPFEKLGSDNLDYMILDENLQKIKINSLLIPYKPENYGIENAEIDSSGNVFLLLKVAVGLHRSALYQNFEEYALLYIPFNSSQIQQLSIKIPNKYIVHANFILEKNKVFICGLTSTNRNPNASGYFTIAMDLGSNKLQRKIMEFDKNILDNFSENSKNQGFQNMKIKHIQNINNDETLVYAEIDFVKDVCYTDPRTGMITCSKHYHSNTGIVLKFDASSVLNETTIIAKRQFSINDNGVNNGALLLSSMNNSNYHLFYNDHEKNKGLLANETKRKTMERGIKSKVFYLFKSGSLPEKSFVLDEDDDKNLLLLPDFQVLEESLNYFILGDRNTYQIIRIRN